MLISRYPPEFCAALGHAYLIHSAVAFITLCVGNRMPASLWFAHGRGLVGGYYVN